MLPTEISANVSVLIPICEDLTLELELVKDYESPAQVNAQLLQASDDDLIPTQWPLDTVTDDLKRALLDSLSALFDYQFRREAS